MGWVYKALIDGITFPLKCPFKPKIYDLVNSTFQVPSFVMKSHFLNGYFCFKGAIIVKTDKSRKFERFVEFKLRGNIVL